MGPDQKDGYRNQDLYTSKTLSEGEKGDHEERNKRPEFQGRGDEERISAEPTQPLYG